MALLGGWSGGGGGGGGAGGERAVRRQEGRRVGSPLLSVVEFARQFLYELPARLPGGNQGFITCPVTWKLINNYYIMEDNFNYTIIL